MNVAPCRVTYQVDFLLHVDHLDLSHPLQRLSLVILVVLCCRGVCVGGGGGGGGGTENPV